MLLFGARNATSRTACSVRLLIRKAHRLRRWPSWKTLDLLVPLTAMLLDSAQRAQGRRISGNFFAAGGELWVQAGLSPGRTRIVGIASGDSPARGATVSGSRPDNVTPHPQEKFHHEEDSSVTGPDLRPARRAGYVCAGSRGGRAAGKRRGARPADDPASRSVHDHGAFADHGAAGPG